MIRRLVVVSGFGPFERIDKNPSAAVARALESQPPEGVDVRAGVLPVSFARATRIWDELVQSVMPRVPDLLVALGVHRQPHYRLEYRARARLTGMDRFDVDGKVASDATRGASGELATSLDVEGLSLSLAARGLGILDVSDDAGGYVCEHLYHHVLSRAEDLQRPALFLHVPHVEFVPIARQTLLTGALIQEALARIALGSG